MWEANEYPQLAANAYFFLTVVRKYALDVPPSPPGRGRHGAGHWPIRSAHDGTYRGVEDFCVLNGRRTDEKYRGSYETSVMKRFGQCANSRTGGTLHVSGRYSNA